MAGWRSSVSTRVGPEILPVACFVIATTTIVAYLQLGPLAGRTTAIDGQWATGFAANFRFIGQGTNYFASGLPPSPLQHYWSLAVEEQFYLVWPTLLFGLVFIGSRFAGSSATVRLGLAALVAASLYWSIHLSASEPTSAYFSPLTRAWELGVGALIASFTVAISRIPSWLRSAASWIGLSLIAVAAFALSATTEFPGYAALLPVFGAALVIAGGIGAPPRGATRMLGLKPLQWLGLVSFSLYLWHWPVFVIAEERSATPLSTAARVVCVLITLVLSAATYYLIEHPLRTSKLLRPTRGRNVWQRSGKALLAGAVAILVALGASAYTNSRAASAINNASRRRSSGHGLTSTLTTTAQLTADEQTASLQRRVRVLVRRGLALHTVPADVDPPVLTLQLIPKHLACLQGLNEVTVRTCTFGAAKSRRTLVVFGDSHATTWMAALDLYGKQTDYRVVTLYKEACPVPSVNAVSRDGPNLACTTWRARHPLHPFAAPGRNHLRLRTGGKTRVHARALVRRLEDHPGVARRHGRADCRDRKQRESARGSRIVSVAPRRRSRIMYREVPISRTGRRRACRSSRVRRIPDRCRAVVLPTWSMSCDHRPSNRLHGSESPLTAIRLRLGTAARRVAPICGVALSAPFLTVRPSSETPATGKMPRLYCRILRVRQRWAVVSTVRGR